MLLKSEGLKISLQTNINYIHRQLYCKAIQYSSATQEQHRSIKFAIKEFDLSKLLINLIYHGYYVVILVLLTFH